MDEFTPGKTYVIPSIPEENTELKANLELAKAASDARFLMIVGKQVKWMQDKANTPANIADDANYAQAIAVVKDMKSTLKSLEEIRLSYVAFPTKVIDMINGLFRQTKRGIEENMTFLSRMAQKWDDEKERERQRKLEEARKLNEEQNPPASIQSEPVDGVSKVSFTEIPPAPNTVTSTKDVILAKKETDFEITVLDKVEFMRLLTSRALNQCWITEHAADLIAIDFEKLKEILRNNPTKRKVAGLKVTKK
jgi:hypothetical protein